MLKMTPKEQVYEKITKEREYQDSKWGSVEHHPHSIPEWIMIMEAELAEAKHAWLKKGEYEAKLEMIQVIAVGIAALEQHGPADRVL